MDKKKQNKIKDHQSESKNSSNKPEPTISRVETKPPPSPKKNK
jgi:hypothetical protein